MEHATGQSYGNPVIKPVVFVATAIGHNAGLSGRHFGNTSLVTVMFGKQKFKSSVAGIGCGYLLKLTVGIIAMMIANSYLVGMFIQANIPYLPELLRDVRLYQFCQIGFPFVMVLVQFWIYDWIRDRMNGAQAE